MNVLTRLWQFLVWFLLLTPLRCLVSNNNSNIPFEPVNATEDGDDTDDSDIDSDTDERIFSSSSSSSTTDLYCSCEGKGNEPVAGVSSVDDTCTCSQSIRNRISSPSSSTSPSSPSISVMTTSSPSSTSPSGTKAQGIDTISKQYPRQTTELYVN